MLTGKKLCLFKLKTKLFKYNTIVMMVTPIVGVVQWKQNN